MWLGRKVGHASTSLGDKLDGFLDGDQKDH